MSKIRTAARSFQRTVTNNSPLILTAFAVAGVVTTTVLAVRATPSALDKIAEMREEKQDELSFIELARYVGPNYIPAFAMGVITISCIVGSHSVNTRRNAALVSAYSLTDTAFKEYQNKVVEVLGTNKEQKIRDEVVKDRVDGDPVSNKQIIITGNGDVLCYDTMSGRYFESNMETLRKAQNDINATTINDMYASQNDFYKLIGLPINGMGEEFGWSTDVMLELDFSTTMSDDNRPCIALSYRMNPIRGYYKMG